MENWGHEGTTQRSSLPPCMPLHLSRHLSLQMTHHLSWPLSYVIYDITWHVASHATCHVICHVTCHFIQKESNQSPIIKHLLDYFLHLENLHLCWFYSIRQRYEEYLARDRTPTIVPKIKGNNCSREVRKLSSGKQGEFGSLQIEKCHKKKITRLRINP